MIWRDDDVDLSELMISELPEAEIVTLLSVFVQCTRVHYFVQPPCLWLENNMEPET